MINIGIKIEADRSLVIEIIKTKLGLDTPSEPLLNFNIDEVEQFIKNYCNIDYVPKELTYTLVNMVCDLYTYNNQVVLDAKATAEEDTDISVSPTGVNSIRVGNTTVTFGSGSDTEARNRALRSHVADLDGLLMNYKSQLNKFRRMVW